LETEESVWDSLNLKGMRVIDSLWENPKKQVLPRNVLTNVKPFTRSWINLYLFIPFFFYLIRASAFLIRSLHTYNEQAVNLQPEVCIGEEG